MAGSVLFDGTDDRIDVSVGRCDFVFGPGTIAFALKRGNAGVAQRPCNIGSTSTSARYGLRFPTGNELSFQCGSTLQTGPFTLLNTDGWAVVAVSKASGSQTPRYHKFVYDTTTHTHTNGSGTVSNSSRPVLPAKIGCLNGSEFFNGNILLAGVWNSVLSDSQIETLKDGVQEWYDLSPRELWPFDRLEGIQSLAGPGVSTEQSRVGTTIDTSDVPAGWDDSLTVTPIAGIGAFALNPRRWVRRGRIRVP